MRGIWLKVLQYKKWLAPGIILAIAVGTGLMVQEFQKTDQTAPQVAKVERSDIFSVVSATGTITPANMVDISSKITGLIAEMKVKENDPVNAGQVLVLLDDTRLQAQLSQARERLENTAANYTRNQSLNKIGALSDQELDAARLDYKVAQANYDDAMSQLDDTVIKSPINGVVIGKPVPAGQTVAPGIANPMVILTVADMSTMQIDTQVDETDIGKVAVGQTATFTVDAYNGRTFTGVVSNISQKATVQQNVVYYNVIIDVHSPEGLLKPTMTARVSINSGESKNTLVAPLSAVKTNKDQQYVVVLRADGQTENVAVSTGLVSDDRVEITGGVNEGDALVLSMAKPQNTGSQSGGIPGLGRGGRIR